jgi:hypothetical protein
MINGKQIKSCFYKVKDSKRIFISDIYVFNSVWIRSKKTSILLLFGIVFVVLPIVTIRLSIKHHIRIEIINVTGMYEGILSKESSLI